MENYMACNIINKCGFQFVVCHASTFTLSSPKNVCAISKL